LSVNAYVGAPPIRRRVVSRHVNSVPSLRSRFGDPRPVSTPVPGPPRRLDLSDRAAGGPLVTDEPHRGQPLVHHIGTDRSIGQLDQLLHLGPERVDQPGPLHRRVDRPALLTSLDVTAHRLGVHPNKSRRRVRTPGGVERFQNLHDLPVRLLHSPSG
jgi:hypothetical protein